MAPTRASGLMGGRDGRISGTLALADDDELVADDAQRQCWTTIRSGLRSGCRGLETRTSIASAT
jgi:hypothetical protein